MKRRAFLKGIGLSLSAMVLAPLAVVRAIARPEESGIVQNKLDLWAKAHYNPQPPITATKILARRKEVAERFGLALREVQDNKMLADLIERMSIGVLKG